MWLFLLFVCQASNGTVFLMSRLPSPNIMCVISVINVYFYVLWWSFVSHVLMLNIPSCFPHTLCPLTPALFFCPVTGCLYRRYVTRTDLSHHSLKSIWRLFSSPVTFILSFPDCHSRPSYFLSVGICILLGCCSLTGFCWGQRSV